MGLRPTTSTFLSSSFVVAFLAYLLGDFEIAIGTVQTRLTNSFGHADSGVKGEAKALLVVIIMILIIPAVGLVFTGGTTGSLGVYTNVTVANTARNGIVQFSQFIGIAMILGIVGVILGLVG